METSETIANDDGARRLNRPGLAILGVFGAVLVGAAAIVIAGRLTAIRQVIAASQARDQDDALASNQAESERHHHHHHSHHQIGTVSGLMEVGSLTVHGPLTVHGQIEVSGGVLVHGPATANRARHVDQNFVPKKELEARVNNGPLTVDGNLIVHGDLRVDGPLTATGDLSSSGRIDVDGPLSEAAAR